MTQRELKYALMILSILILWLVSQAANVSRCMERIKELEEQLNEHIKRNSDTMGG